MIRSWARWKEGPSVQVRPAQRNDETTMTRAQSVLLNGEAQVSVFDMRPQALATAALAGDSSVAPPRLQSDEAGTTWLTQPRQCLPRSLQIQVPQHQRRPPRWGCTAVARYSKQSFERANQRRSITELA